MINNKPQRICSIDASTNSMAFAIFDGLKLEACGKITFNGATTYEKVADACRKVNSFIGQFNIEAIIIEHTVFINSPKTAADLALVQGAMLGAAGIHKINIAGSVNPITWQIAIGNGKLTKPELLEIKKNNPGKSEAWLKNYAREIRKNRTIKFVNTYYDKQITDNDIADAIGIGHWAIHNWGKLTK